MPVATPQIESHIVVSPAISSRYLAQSLLGGVFHGLRPVSQDEVAEIAHEHPGISTSYLAFIAQIGVGSCEAGNIYAPVPVEELIDHQSYKLYRSEARLRLFGKSRPVPFPLGAVMVADTGASWKYGFGPELGEPIQTFDLSDASLERSHDSFDHLIVDWLAAKPA